MYTRYRDMSMARFVQARILCYFVLCFRVYRVRSDLKGIIYH